MLICEACGHEMAGRVCETCRRDCPADAKYCAYCGVRFPDAVEKPATGKKRDPYDLETRILCSDDACIGIIGPAGVCTVCGCPPSSD